MFVSQKYIRPLLKLRYKNKTSHIFGSIHSTNLNKLTYDGTLYSIIHPNYKIIDFLKTRKTLITECGGCCFGNESTHYLDSEKNIVGIYNIQNLDSYKSISKEKDDYSKILLLNKHIFDNNINIEYYKKNFVANKFTPNMLSSLKLNNEKLYYVLEEIVKIYHPIFNNVNDINLTFFGKILYDYMIYDGMDINLVISYMEQNKKIYSIDNPIINSDDSIFLDNFNKVIKSLATVLLFQSLITKRPIIDIINNDYKNYGYQDFVIDTNKINEETYIVNDRNKFWRPWIIRYHLETEDPLFVFGLAHLNGKYGVINLLKNEGFDIEINDDF